MVPKSYSSLAKMQPCTLIADNDDAGVLTRRQVVGSLSDITDPSADLDGHIGHRWPTWVFSQHRWQYRRDLVNQVFHLAPRSLMATL